MGAIPSPILQTLGLIFLALVQAWEVPLVSQWGQGSMQTFLFFLFGERHPLKDLLIGEGEVPSYLLPELQNTSR